jgi:hypothetical protein
MNDHFLAWNESLRSIGALMIAAVILEREAENKVRAGGWYRLLVHKLLYGCSNSIDLFKNQVKFITFNYDASLEFHLFKALSSIDILSKADVERFLSQDRIVHMYGCVHDRIPTEDDFIETHAAVSLDRSFGEPLDFSKDFAPRKKLLDYCLGASKTLLTIDPHDKAKDKTLLAQARRWIDNASVIYILGYGFDSNNNQRIGLDPILSRSNKAVMFTNFDDLNTINKRASKLCFGDHDSFLRYAIIGRRTDRYFEKSVRNVYDALEKDFDALEGELVSGSSI